MVTEAVNQIQDSSIFDHEFIWQWKEKSDTDKIWANMKDYYKAEYQAIKAYSEVELTNLLHKQQEVSQFFKEFRWDAMVNAGQINQRQQSFCGAADMMGGMMACLKAAITKIKVLNKTNQTLSDANKQLTVVVASLEKKVGKIGSHTTTQTA